MKFGLFIKEIAQLGFNATYFCVKFLFLAHNPQVIQLFAVSMLIEAVVTY